MHGRVHRPAEALFHQIGASLAGGSVLIARTTAATDGADVPSVDTARTGVDAGNPREKIK
jgi:hypothetical protein